MEQLIKGLLQHQSDICLTLVVPMHRVHERTVDALIMKKALIQAKETLINKYGNTEAVTGILNKLAQKVHAVDFTQAKDGLGIYISNDKAEVIEFPFPVIYKVKIGEVFDRMDLLYYLQQSATYYVLSLRDDEIRLYKGSGETLEEVINNDFPVVYEEEYEYSKPAIANSYGSGMVKNFERDKTEIKQVRWLNFFQSADEKLKKYLSPYTPLIVTGGKKQISNFMDISWNSRNMIAKVEGYYFADKALSEQCEGKILEYNAKKSHEALMNLNELEGRDLLAGGIENVWEEAQNGNAYKLYIEKDYASHTYLGKENGLMESVSVNEKAHCLVRDSVDQILKMVEDKGGEIIFTNNGTLEKYFGIALQLRHRDE